MPRAVDRHQELLHLKQSLVAVIDSEPLLLSQLTLVDNRITRPRRRVCVIEHCSTLREAEPAVLPYFAFLCLVFGVETGKLKVLRTILTNTGPIIDYGSLGGVGYLKVLLHRRDAHGDFVIFVMSFVLGEESGRRPHFWLLSIALR